MQHMEQRWFERVCWKSTALYLRPKGRAKGQKVPKLSGLSAKMSGLSLQKILPMRYSQGSRASAGAFGRVEMPSKYGKYHRAGCLIEELGFVYLDTLSSIARWARCP